MSETETVPPSTKPISFVALVISSFLWVFTYILRTTYAITRSNKTLPNKTETCLMFFFNKVVVLKDTPR